MDVTPAKQRELIMARRLVDHLREQGLDLGDPVLGDIGKREPDAVCPASGIGIEVAGAYYSADEARDTWGVARGRPEQSRRLRRPGEPLEDVVKRAPVLRDADQALVENLRRTMAAHCAKAYSVETYLLLDIAHPGAGLPTAYDDARWLVPLLSVPSGCAFVKGYIAMLGETMGRPAFFELPGSKRPRSRRRRPPRAPGGGWR